MLSLLHLFLSTVKSVDFVYEIGKKNNTAIDMPTTKTIITIMIMKLNALFYGKSINFSS